MDEQGLIKKLREAIPLPGMEWTYLWRLVVKPGSAVDFHTHHHWVACIHIPPAKGDPHIELIVGGKTIMPEPWGITVIPPNTAHAVLEWKGVNDRKSFALAVTPGDNRQVIKNVVR